MGERTRQRRRPAVAPPAPWRGEQDLRGSSVEVGSVRQAQQELLETWTPPHFNTTAPAHLSEG